MIVSAELGVIYKRKVQASVIVQCVGCYWCVRYKQVLLSIVFGVIDTRVWMRDTSKCCYSIAFDIFIHVKYKVFFAFMTDVKWWPQISDVSYCNYINTFSDTDILCTAFFYNTMSNWNTGTCIIRWQGNCFAYLNTPCSDHYVFLA